MHKSPRATRNWIRDIPRVNARWVLAKRYHGNESLELPISMMLGKSFVSVRPPGTNSIVPLYAKNEHEGVNNPLHSRQHKTTKN